MYNKIISIIIATYNASDTILKCLDSIENEINSDCELIIIDGNSTDNTLDLLNKKKGLIDVLISEPDKGIYDAWNKGIERSKGKWIMFLGADDILLPGSIKSYFNVLTKLNKDNEPDYICARNEYVDEDGNLIMMLGKPVIWDNMRKMNMAAHVGSLHNKFRLFNQVGLYDLKFKICGDYELLLRKKEKLKSIFVPNIIARMYTGGMSFTYKAILEVYYIRKLHRSVSNLMNVILFIRDILFFSTFSLRKKT